jgi:6-phosphogluconolactonase
VTGDTTAVVRIFPDSEVLGRAAADRFVTLAAHYVAAQGRFSVALSGGTSPKRMYTLLSTPPYRDAVHWPKVHVFWADERCVPPDHPASNYKLALDTFLSRVPVPEENIHRVKGEEAPDTAAFDYEKDLRIYFNVPAVPSFDLIVLGAGEDGHTASLFPGTPFLQETARLAAPVYRERPNRDRVTLTLPVLNHAAHVLFLAAGRAKAGILSGIFHEKNAKGYPAGFVRPLNGEVTWLIDEESAEKLKSRA